MGQILTGIGFVLFGLIVGGVGVATAGVGIGVPMIPIGIYLIYYGLYQKKNAHTKRIPYWKTKQGKLVSGILLIFIGAALTTVIIGIPIMGYGVFMIYKALSSNSLGGE